MSFNYRFEPPTVRELEDMAHFECPYEYQCENCEYDCYGEAEPL